MDIEPTEESRARILQTARETAEMWRKHYNACLKENDWLRGFLQREGYRQCDIPACNCGSWHKQPKVSRD